jgi:hypothetical protein
LEHEHNKRKPEMNSTLSNPEGNHLEEVFLEGLGQTPDLAERLERL